MQTANAYLRLAVASVLLLLWASTPADPISWNQQSQSYDVHLGVVPPTVLQQDDALHRLHPGVDHRGSSSRHILVAVFKRPWAKRVQNAEVTAEVIENDLVHARKAQKPLHAMTVSGTVTYCNFFDLHWNGQYKVRVMIREPNERPEEVTFIQKIGELHS